MTQYRVELKKSNTGDDDWGSLFFHVFAKTDKEAWKKACDLEDASNIKRIYPIKFIG